MVSILFCEQDLFSLTVQSYDNFGCFPRKIREKSVVCAQKPQEKGMDIQIHPHICYLRFAK